MRLPFLDEGKQRIFSTLVCWFRWVVSECGDEWKIYMDQNLWSFRSSMESNILWDKLSINIIILIFIYFSVKFKRLDWIKSVDSLIVIIQLDMFLWKIFYSYKTPKWTDTLFCLIIKSLLLGWYKRMSIWCDNQIDVWYPTITHHVSLCNFPTM